MLKRGEGIPPTTPPETRKRHVRRPLEVGHPKRPRNPTQVTASELVPSSASWHRGRRKSFRRKAGKMGSHHAVRISKSTWHQIKIRERRGPRRGITQEREPHQRRFLGGLVGLLGTRSDLHLWSLGSITCFGTAKNFKMFCVHFPISDCR